MTARSRICLGVAATGAIFLAIVAGQRSPARTQPPKILQGAGQANSDYAKVLHGIAQAYNIEIITENPVFPIKTSHGNINGTRADAGPIQAYCELFAAEFSLYPPAFVRRSSLKRIVLCTGLTLAGEVRGALPDFEHDTLYFDVNWGSYNRSYVRKGIHHEYFHIIDYRDDGIVYGDDSWSSLNPSTFRYGNGGRSAQSIPTSSLLTEKYPGFLNHYSTTGVEEDKAELFANLIVEQATVTERAERDPVLMMKVEQMKALMAAFCPEMNSAFWERARQLDRGRP